MHELELNLMGPLRPEQADLSGFFPCLKNKRTSVVFYLCESRESGELVSLDFHTGHLHQEIVELSQDA